MLAAAGVGAGRMAGDDVVDFQTILDGADALFQAAVGCHLSAPFLCFVHRRGITSPMAPASCAEKNSRPSGIATMARAPHPSTGIGYSPTTFPPGVMCPILLEAFSVNQRSPSGATATPRSEALGVLTGHSVMRPCASMRPSALALVSTNQILPSGCAAMARGSLFAVGISYSVT